MTLYDIKPKFQNLLRPAVATLHRWGITANQVTLLAMGLSVALGSVLMLYPIPVLFSSLPIYLFFRMALNAMDGMLAREFNQQTTLGALSPVRFLVRRLAWMGCPRRFACRVN